MDNYRRERIERLLEELRYEVERGMMQGEIDETISYEFIVPISKSIPHGVVYCCFRTRPQLHYPILDNPRGLNIIKGGKDE